MKKLILMCLTLLALTSCGDNPSIGVVNGRDGINGIDGQDGSNGEDGAQGAILSRIIVPEDACVKILSGVYVENIRQGIIFDVYMDDSCSDRVNGELNEFCDNVETQFGQSGDIGQGEAGAGDICWVDNNQISGIRKEDNSIEIRILTFGE